MATIGHTGSWGTPDLGVTEWVSKLLGGGGGVTTQGGSNLSAPYSAPAELTSQQNLASQQNWSATQPTNPTGGLTYKDLNSYLPATGGDSSGQVSGINDGGNNGGDPGINLDSVYNDAFRSLDDQWGGLEQSAGFQNQQAQGVYDTQNRTLSNTFNQNVNELQSGQTKALTDLGDSMRQQWQQGNTMLGTRGASDSSAAKMYSYALTKLGSKQRGDISAEYARMQNNLKTTYDTNIQNLGSWLNGQKAQIGQWLAEAQNSLRGVRADLQREKSQQALNMALSSLQQAQQDAANKRSILDQWVANRANTLGELVSGLNANTSNMPTFQGLNGTPTGNTGYNWNMTGYGSADEKNRLF